MRWSRPFPKQRRRVAFMAAVTLAGPAALLATPGTASAGTTLTPGDLLVSTSVWQQNANITAGTTQLPPGCGTLADNPCTTAVAPGTYPVVFNNDSVDGSFGVTQPIVLDQLNPTNGQIVSSLTVPNSSQGLGSSADQLVTSFSSKSELALNQSTDGNYVTFMGYVAPVGAIDVSNSNTPGAVDPTNSGTTTPYYRAVGQVDVNGNYQFTETNAYSGNNGRAAILNPSSNTLYSVGNAGNGANPEPQGVVEGAGSQNFSSSTQSESAQNPGAPTPLGDFNVTQLGDKADKSAKDDNFRGLTSNGNVLYFTKGSGSNGVDTVYFLDSTGTSCPSGGVGLPASGATLPSASTFTSPAFSTSNAALGLTTANPGLAPTNMCILSGFPTAIAKNATDSSLYPFGLWFANPDTLYVADEGSGDATYSSTSNTYSAAAASTTAGLQKWTFNASTNQWVLDYTLQSGLNLGQPYAVADSGSNVYPTGLNSTDGGGGLPWAPATDGLRNLTGQVNSNGTVTIWAATSTVSGDGDQGADPNQLVSITDNLSATSAPSGESFTTVMPATYGQVIRGVSFTPGTNATPPAQTPEVPWAPLLPLTALAIGTGVYMQRRFRRPRHVSI